ncbi:interleukin-1 receptor-associated kinase 1-binding protein 1 isoform X2 [Camarhynchus parvulus]|uniref:interleukin-1 receptor-associated kinase 1-binding protein 1 isoform X2 n=1 Tax=Geospiza parvula TaxID=87175 RepID=UPI001237C703|nr:interleukin-1 receptor-associated kinase 1-binding protein 1 isoform X2 [Camarhynchus parvulus]
MAPPAPPPSRVFAELDLAPSPASEARVEPAALPGREVHVSGSAELSARPDRARVSLRLGSRKEAAVAARSSVSRRLQYIAHTARLHGIPEENMTVTEDFSRVENTYQMEAEVCIIFSDFGKMQNVCNLLIEKLGTSVTINPPHFYHTPEAIDTLRVRSVPLRYEILCRKSEEQHGNLQSCSCIDVRHSNRKFRQRHFTAPYSEKRKRKILKRDKICSCELS